MSIDPQRIPVIRDLAIIVGHATSEAILVGGQSVLFWAEKYGVKVDDLLPALTEDVDFVAGITDIMDADNALSAKYQVDTKIATMDESAPNSGKMTVHHPYGKINIDFLRMITGLDSGEIADDAITLSIDGIDIKVISPVNLLKSKVSNISSHLSKRNPEGIEQARITIEIVKRYLTEKISINKKLAYRDFEKIIRLGMGDPALYSSQFFKIDIFDAIPVEALGIDDPFVEKRLPVAREQIRIRREKFAAMVERMAEFDNDAATSRFQP